MDNRRVAKKIFKYSLLLLLFPVGVCHPTGESLFLFYVHWRVLMFYGENGLVFLKCLLCNYLAKKEISSTLSRGSHSSPGGQRDIMFPSQNYRHTAKRKSWDNSGLLNATCKLVAIIGSERPSCCPLLDGCSKENLLLSPLGNRPQSDGRLDKSEAISQALESLQFCAQTFQMIM